MQSLMETYPKAAELQGGREHFQRKCYYQTDGQLPRQCDFYVRLCFAGEQN